MFGLGCWGFTTIPWLYGDTNRVPYQLFRHLWVAFMPWGFRVEVRGVGVFEVWRFRRVQSFTLHSWMQVRMSSLLTAFIILEERITSTSLHNEDDRRFVVAGKDISFVATTLSVFMTAWCRAISLMRRCLPEVQSQSSSDRNPVSPAAPNLKSQFPSSQFAQGRQPKAQSPFPVEALQVRQTDYPETQQESKP